MATASAKAHHLKAAHAAAKASPTASAKAGKTKGTCPAKTPAVPPKSKVLRAYFAQLMEHSIHSGKKRVKNVSFEAISNAIVGCKVCVVVETSDLQAGEITLQILGSNNSTFVTADAPATFLSAGADTNTFKAKVGNFSTKKEYHNAASYKNVAVFELELRKKEDAATKDYIKKIGDSKEHCAYLHLSLTASGGTDTEYNCEDETLASPNKEKAVFYNKKNAWFELYACLCDKKLISFDLQRVGISKANATKFLSAINDALASYSINTCLRISHFLAQVRHESGDFVYMKELWGPSDAQNSYEGRVSLGNVEVGDGKKFMGRGLIQITGRTNYTAYGKYKGEDFTTGTNNEKLEQINYAVDSAGWYWSEHLDVDLNNSADKDDAINCTYRINGGFNGFRPRERNTLEALHALAGCRNTDLSSKGVYSLDSSDCYGIDNAVYKWANMLHDEGTDASKYYQHYLDLTDLMKETKSIKDRRKTAASRIKKK